MSFVIGLIQHNKNDKSYIKPYLGLIITLAVFCIAPAHDMFYYAAALTSIGVAMLSIGDMVEKFNILTSRKLPQLGKRGGDENA